MPEVLQCRSCGADLSLSTLDGLCPSCTADLAFGLALGEADAGSLEDATEFGKFTLLEEIARGGMGVVFRARENDLNRIVAVKMILAGRFASEDHIARFRAEAEAVAALRHPNIVAIHEVGEVAGQHFFSMDFVSGSNLSRLVEDQGLPVREAAEFVKTVAEAVHYAHENGVIHRDIKPSNILVDVERQPVITDFGLAKRLAEADPEALTPELTLSGQVVGSPSFSAPELAGGRGRHAGPAADVYSLGAVLYFALTGRPPFVADNFEQVLKLVLTAEPVSPTLLHPGLPRDLETICLKALAKESEQRYGTAREISDELGRYLRGESIRARPVGALGKTWRWARRNRAVAALAMVAVVAFMAGILGVAWQWVRAESHAEAEAVERERAEETLSSLQLRHADMRLRQGESAEGLAYLARVLRDDPGNHTAATRLVSVLTRRSFALPLGAPMMHDLGVNDAVFSPDGKVIATASDDCTARLWDGAGGAPVGAPMEHGSKVRRILFSPDGTLVATLAGLNARIWDARTGLPRTASIPHDGLALCADFHPTRPLLVIGTEKGGVRVWSFSDPARLATIVDLKHVNGVGHVEFSSDGRRLLSAATFPGVASVHDVSDGELVREFKIGRSTLLAARLSPDGERVAVANYAGMAHVWEIGSGKEVHRFRHERVCNDVAFSPDGQLLATASRGQRAAVWDLVSGELLRLFPEHQSSVESVEFSSDGLRLLAREHGKRALVWDLLTGERVCEPVRFEGGLRSIRFDRSGGRAVAATARGRAQVWDVQSGSGGWVPIIRAGGPLLHAQFARAGEVVVTTAYDGGLAVWDVLSGTCLHSTQVRSVNVARSNRNASAVLVGGWDGTVTIWNARTDEKRAISNEHKHAGRVAYLEFSPDESKFLTASFDGTARVWDSATLEPLTPPMRHRSRLWQASFDPEGARIVTAEDLGRAVIWDAETGERLVTLGHPGAVFRAIFDPTGRLVAAACDEPSARIWEAASGRLLHTLKHDSFVRHVRFDGSGERLATGSLDNTARIWNVSTGLPVTAPMHHGHEVVRVGFDAPGARVATASRSGAAQLWDARRGTPLGEPLVHFSGINRALFNADGTRLLTVGAHARIWDLPDLSGIPPGWLADLAESIAGMRLDDRGLVPSAGEPWSQLRQRIHESSDRDSWIGRWASWFFAARESRPISAAHPMTMSEMRVRLFEATKTRECVIERLRTVPDDGEAWWNLQAIRPVLEGAEDAAVRRYAARKALAACRVAISQATDRQDRAILKLIARHRELLRERGEEGRAQREWLEQKGIPQRPDEISPQCLDLSAHYNVAFDEPWHMRSAKGNDLKMLAGTTNLAGIPFDLRGLIQLDGSSLRKAEPGFPEAVSGIRVAQKCDALYFLQACAWGQFVASGTMIGSYRVHFGDGESMEVPLTTGENLHEWHVGEWSKADLPGARQVKVGANAAGNEVQLFLMEWVNPRPGVEIASLEFRSAMTAAAPFLVAITAAK